MQIASSLLDSLQCEWGSFKLGDLFDIQCSKYHNPNNYKEGEIPYIARTTFNNGVIKKISTNENLYPANCIIIGAESAKAFYQKSPFLTGNKIYRLYLKKEFGTLNQNLALFICALINKVGEKYNYTEAFISSRVEKESIDLPINLEKTPDFSLMENFIKNIEQEHTQKLLAYYKAVGGGAFNLKAYQAFNNPLSTYSLQEQSLIQGALMQIAKCLFDALQCEWGSFKLGDLFCVKNNPQLNKDSFEFSDNAEYPYFTRTVYNNGILGYVKYLDEEHKIRGNSIAVGLIAMQFFYMEKDFYAGQFTKTIYPKFENFNKNLGLFFASLFNANKNKYLKNFIVKDFVKDFSNTIISLPIDSKGQPDFALMENFIKTIEQEHTQKLLEYYKLLKAVRGGGIEFKLKEYLAFYEKTKSLKSIETKALEWREFKIEELFILATKPKLRSKADIETNGKIPIYSSDTSNGGIIGYCNKSPSFKISDENPFFVVFGDHTRAMNIATTDFCVTDNVKVLIPKYANIRYLLYIFAVWKKCIPNLGYARHWSIAKNSLIQLPVYRLTEVEKVDSTFLSPSDSKPYLCFTNSTPCHPKSSICHFESRPCHSKAKVEESLKSPKQPQNTIGDKDYKIAFDVMENFIKAIEKESIKDVVLWGEKRLEAYRTCVESKRTN